MNALILALALSATSASQTVIIVVQDPAVAEQAKRDEAARVEPIECEADTCTTESV